MDLNNSLDSIGNATKSVLSGIGQGVGSVTNAIGNVLGSWSKGLNDQWQSAQQGAQQGLSNLQGNVQNITTSPTYAQSIPQASEDQINQWTNDLAKSLPPGAPQIGVQAAGRGAGGLLKGFARIVTTPFTQKSGFEHAADVLSGVGAVAMPEQSLMAGAFNVPFSMSLNAGGDLLQGKMPQMPTAQQAEDAYQQGIEFGTQLGPVSKIAAIPLSPLLAKISPAGVTGLIGLGQRMLAQGISGGVGSAVMGGLAPANSPQERVQHAISQGGQGFAMSAAMGVFSKPSLPELSEQYTLNKNQVQPGTVITSKNGVKYTTDALDAYGNLVPTIAGQQQEFAQDPDGAMRKMLSEDTYDKWYKAQPMNHSKGGNTVLKDARGTFSYINPQDIPQHAQDTNTIIDGRVVQQMTENNGYPKLAVLRQTYDAQGNPNPLDITDGHHRFPLGKDIGLENIPAIILDDTKPLLRDQFNQMKGIADMTIGQMQGITPPQGKTLTQLDFENAKKAYMAGNTKAEATMQSNAERLHGENAAANFEDAYHARNYDLAREIAENSQVPSIQNLAKRLPTTSQAPQSIINPVSGGQEANLSFLKNPQKVQPTDIGDIENPVGNGLVGRDNAPLTTTPLSSAKMQENPYLTSQFVSNNTGQMDVNQALSKLNSPEHQALIQNTVTLHDQASVPVLKTESLLGDTKSYGTENSIRSDFMADADQARTLAAQKGLAENQLSVLSFMRDTNGPDALIEFSMPKKLTLPQVRAILDKAGLEYRSINPQTNGVTIVDQGRQNVDTINALLKKYDITGQIRQGTAEFTGDTSENPTREGAAKIYQQILQSGGYNTARVGNSNTNNGTSPSTQIPQIMPEQGNVLAGMKSLNQTRPLEVTPGNEQLAKNAMEQGLDITNPNNTLSNRQLAMNQLRGVETPPGNLQTNSQLAQQQLDQTRLSQNPDFYGTQANQPASGAPRPPAELDQALQMKQEVRDNLTNAKLLQDNYEQYKIQAQQSGQSIATKTQLKTYVKTLQKNADTLDARIKTLQPDDPLIQNQIQATQNAPMATQIANDAASQNGAQVLARIKSTESMADQMNRKGKASTDINDSLGLRVIAPTQQQADATLEQIKADPRIKLVKQEMVNDQQTGYAANHLDVKIGDNPQTVEIQGMTQDMARLAQDTHDQYKVVDNAPTKVQIQRLAGMGYGQEQLSKITQADAKGIIQDGTPPPDHPSADLALAKAPPAPGSATLDDALSARFSTMQNIGQRTQTLVPLINSAVKGSAETEAFRQAVEHPNQIYDLAQNTHNPAQFIDAVNRFNQFNDYVYKTAQESGLGMGYVKDYYSHILDLSTPEMQAKFDAYMQQKANNYQGWFSKSRIFNNIDDLRANGFQLKNPNVPLDLQEYSRAAQLAIGNSALLQNLSAYKPGEVASIRRQGLPVNENGRPYVQSQIPGLGDTALSPSLAAELKAKVGNSLDSGSIDNLSKYYDKANSFLKQMELSGGGFHILNTAPNYLADQLFGRHVPNVLQATRVFLSPSAMNDYRQNAVESGLIDKAGAMNVTLSKAQDISTDSEGNINTGNVNPLHHPLQAINQGIFGRLMDYFKLEAVKNVNADLSTPEGIADARDIGAQINNMFGGQNRATGDSIIKSKGMQQLARAVFLAPDYQEGRIANTVSAVKGLIPGLSDVGSRYATKELLGRIAVTGILAEAARYLISGKADANAKDLFQHAFLDPQIPLPFTDTKDRALIGRLPTSEPSDMYRASQDPAHFLMSHLGALPSTIVSAVTQKNYYGDQLTDPYAPPSGPIEGAWNQIKALGASKLPIPVVQGMKVWQGKENLPMALTNTAGIRVAQNPTNPGVVFEKNKSDFMKNLTPNDAAVFNTLFPQKTDPYTGNPITSYSMLDKNQKAFLELNHLPLMQKIGEFEKQTAQQNGQQSDPIYDLSPDKQRMVLTMRTFLPGEGKDTKKALVDGNPWYKDFLAKEDAYYKSFSTQDQISQLPRVNVSPALQELLDTYSTLPSGTGDKTRFLTAHPEILTYWNQIQDLTNAERADLNLPLIQGTSSSFGSRSSSSSSLESYLDRALLRRSLFTNIPQTKFAPVPKLFMEPGQSPTSGGILKIGPGSEPKKPMTALRAGGTQQPSYSRMTVKYQRPQFVTSLRSMGGVR